MTLDLGKFLGRASWPISCLWENLDDSHIRILMVLAENAHLNTKRSHEGKLESNRSSDGSGFRSISQVEKGTTQAGFNVGLLCLLSVMSETFVEWINTL
jgi:hypothetical protein